MNKLLKTLFILMLSCLCENKNYGAIVNILTNGSFEKASDLSTEFYQLGGLPLIAPATSLSSLEGWSYRDIGNAGSTSSGANGYSDSSTAGLSQSFSTPFGNRFLIFGNGTENPGNELYQSGINLTPGIYRASLNARGYGHDTWSVFFGLAITNDSNNEEIKAETFGPLGRGEVWSEYSFQFEILQNTQISFRISDKTATAPSADVHLDNAILQLVPEPSALSLLAVGLGVVIRRRRRAV